MSSIVEIDCVLPNQHSSMEKSQQQSSSYVSYNGYVDTSSGYMPDFKRPESKTFVHSMLLLGCSNQEDTVSEKSALHLEPKPLRVVDHGDNQKNPASGNNAAETTAHIAHSASATVLPMQQTGCLNKSRVEIETSLIENVCNDDAERLVCLLQSMMQALKVVNGEQKAQHEDFEAIFCFWFPHRLLQLACQLDSVTCAEALLEGEIGLLSPVNAVDEAEKTALHFAASKLATRCIDLLLRRRAKTDMRSQDGCIPLESALRSKRWPNNLQTLSAIDIITTLSNQDLTALKLLADHTKDVLCLACHLAFDGDAVGMAALLLAAGKSLLGDEQKYESFLDLVVEKVLSRLRGNNNSRKSSVRDPTKACDTDESEYDGYRSSILKCLDIIVRLKRELACSSSHLPYKSQGKGQSALLRAAQAGDEGIIKILLNDTSIVNEMDSDGNTALHWCLKTTKGLRIVWQLITHGSSVSARNRLGLTPVHIAAGQGHLQALQLLLAQDPGAVHIASVTKETPLFSAVKNNHVECAKLLLQFGSNAQVLNLRRQRPVDFAGSQEMRMILSENGRRATGKVQANSHLKFFNSVMDNYQSQGEPGIPNLEDGADFKVQIHGLIEPQDDLDNLERWALTTQHAKTSLCRYHMMPGGCARGEQCFYAHGEQELRPEAREKAGKVNNVFDHKKIFVGGLLPAMGSDDLKNFFEGEFGPVQEAIVMNSQTGGHIQSRGFGFVTFKNEASCIAAVKQHFLTICGKRVEIKAAFQSSKRTDEEMLSIHLSNPPGLVSNSQETFKNSKWNIMTTDETSTSFKNETFTHLKGETAAICQAENATSSSSRKCNPPWLAVFKKWLPAFLSSVSRRQRGAEYYPLSSVKADFRATCGMELDHIALGFPKLSDFLRTMPELCRMKIVPVGRGPATHVVLHMRQQGLVPKPHQLTMATKISTSSLVHEGRTYAAAASHNTASSSENKMAVQNTDSEDSFLVNSQSIMGSGSNPDNNSGAHHFLGPASIFEDSTEDNYNGQREEIVDSNNLSLFSATFNTEELQQQKLPTVDSFKAWQQGFAGTRLTTPENLQDILWASITNAHFQRVTPEAPATQPPPQQLTHTFSNMYHYPYCMEQKLPVSPTLERALPTFQRDNPPFYNPWNSDTFEGCRNLIQQMNLAATGEESPQSSLTSEDSLESPRKLFEDSLHPCVLCGDKAAVWVAIPCTHKAICSPCKTQLHKTNSGLQQCFICQGRAREWIAQYY